MDSDEVCTCRCKIISEKAFDISNLLTQSLLSSKMFEFGFDGQNNKNLSFLLWVIKDHVPFMSLTTTLFQVSLI